MSTVSELIRVESNGNISFGDYTLAEKAKLDNFEHKGDIYKVKTCKEITKLEGNGMFVYESVPGTAVNDFAKTEDKVSFVAEGTEDAEVTLELAADTEYEITVDGNSVGTMKTNLGGKLTVGLELADADAVSVVIEKK